jgi:hypothetical protein
MGGCDRLVERAPHPATDDFIHAVHLGGHERRVAEQSMLPRLHKPRVWVLDGAVSLAWFWPSAEHRAGGHPRGSRACD